MRRMAQVASAGLLATALALGSVGCGLSPVPIEQKSEQKSDQNNQTSAQSAPSTSNRQNNSGTDVMSSDGGESYMSSETEAGLGAMGYMEPTFNTEDYASVEESGFVSTAASPLSTVSADVDTASYANIRRMLRDGYAVASDKATDAKTTDQKTDSSTVDIDSVEYYYGTADKTIPKGAVRIEEMLNYFDYAYAGPEGEDAFGTTVRIGDCPWNADTKLMAVGFATAPEDPAVAQTGSNLVFLIDVSGSMDDADKLPLLQSAFGKLVETLGEHDRVSIVTYSGQEEVVLDGESGANHLAIMKAIRALDANGSTNGEAGLRMAYQIAEKNFIKGGVNRIVMASDGDLNVGMTSESDLHDFVDKKRATGVYLSVLGFGSGNYKDAKMETLADHGNGSYHYIDCEDEAVRVFSDRLTANLVPFANDVKVQVEFNPAQLKGYRLIGYENRTMAAEDFKDDAKDAGEVGPASQFTVLYEIVPNDSALDIPVPELKYGQGATEQEGAATAGEWLTIKLRYKAIDGGAAREQERVVSAQDWSEDPGADWRFAAAVTEFGMLLRNSEYKGTSSFDSVRKLVDAAGNQQRKEFLELVDLAQKN